MLHTIGVATTLAYKSYFTGELASKNITIIKHLLSLDMLQYDYILGTKQQQLTPTILMSDTYYNYNLLGKVYMTSAYIKFIYDIIIPSMIDKGLFNKSNTLSLH